MNQVHKENLSQVENALANRQGLEVEIFGMEGIPQEILDQHRNRIIQNFYQAQEDRRLATGNPLPGQTMKNSRKKLKIESTDELKKRLEEFRAQKKAAPASGGDSVAPTNGSPGSFVSSPSSRYMRVTDRYKNPPFQPPQQQYEQPYGQPGFPAQAPPNAAYNQPPYGYSPNPLPARPGANLPNAPGLPQRPTQGGFWNGPGAPPPGADGAAPGDDIDKLIRMAEAGIKPAQKPEEETGEKKKKDKDKKGKMFYDDAEVSPEERMAALSRYAFTPEAAAA